MIEVKQVTPQLAAGVHRISETCLQGEGWTLAQYRDACQSGNLFLCAVQGDTVAGFIQCDVVYDSANLNLIAVDEGFRRQNIAAGLIQTAEKILLEYKTANDFASVVFSLEVRSQNTSAQNLYQKCGFARAGLRKNFYQDPQDDAVIYTKEL